MHMMACVFDLALARAGSNRPARIAMMAITTRSSIRVKAFRQKRRFALNVRRLFACISSQGLGFEAYSREKNARQVCVWAHTHLRAGLRGRLSNSGQSPAVRPLLFARGIVLQPINISILRLRDVQLQRDTRFQGRNGTRVSPFVYFRMPVRKRKASRFI